MTANGWLQIVVFFAAVLAVTHPAGRLPVPRARGGAITSSAPARLARAARLPGRRASTAASRRGRPTRGAARVQRAHDARDLRDPAPAAPAAVQPAEPRTGRGRLRVQHRGELHHEHELAGVRRRGDDELPEPDGGAGLAQLHLGGGGHRRRDGPRPRADARGEGKGPGTIGNFWVDLTRATVYVLLPICRRGRAGARLPGGDPEPRPLPRRSRRWRAGSQVIAMGPVASQEAIKQLGTNGGGFFNANAAHPFENPNPCHELPLDDPDLRDPRGAHLHVRADGEGPAAGLGAVRRDGVPVLRRRDGGVLGRGARQPGRRRPGRRARARQHGGQGGPLRRRELGRSTPR